MEGGGDDSNFDHIGSSGYETTAGHDSGSQFRSDQKLLSDRGVKKEPSLKPFEVSFLLNHNVSHGKIYDLVYVKEKRNFVIGTSKGICVMHLNLKAGTMAEKYFLPLRCKVYSIFRGRTKNSTEEGQQRKRWGILKNQIEKEEITESSKSFIPKCLRIPDSTFLAGLQRGNVAKFTTHGAGFDSYIRFMKEIYVGAGPIIKLCEAPDKSILAFSSSGCVSVVKDDVAATGRLTKDCVLFGAVVIKGSSVSNSRIYVASSASVVPIYKPSQKPGDFVGKFVEEEKEDSKKMEHQSLVDESDQCKKSDKDSPSVNTSSSKGKKEEEEEKKEEGEEVVDKKRTETENNLLSGMRQINDGVEKKADVVKRGPRQMDCFDELFMRVKSILGNKSAGIPSAMTGHGASIRDVIKVDVDTDDILIATASADKSFGLWHVATRVTVRTEKGNSDATDENDSGIKSLDTSQKSGGVGDAREAERKAVSLRVGDTKTYKMVRTLNFTPTSTYLIGLYTAHSKKVISIVYSKRMKLLLAGSKDGTISMWYLGKAKHFEKKGDDSDDILKLGKEDQKRAEFLMYGHVGIFKLTMVERFKVGFKLKKLFIIDTGYADVLAVACGNNLHLYEISLSPDFTHLLDDED